MARVRANGRTWRLVRRVADLKLESRGHLASVFFVDRSAICAARKSRLEQAPRSSGGIEFSRD